MPYCINYADPAKTTKVKKATKANRDRAYRVHPTHSGTVPTILCKACKNNPPIKYNASIISEIRRLAACTGLWHPSARSYITGVSVTSTIAGQNSKNDDKCPQKRNG